MVPGAAQNSNRQTYEKLEVGVSHRKQSPEVISNRQESALHPRYRGKTKENGGTPREAEPRHRIQRYIISTQKLEILLSAAKPATCKFLIDKFSPHLNV
jgi:hypothetical protein